MEALTERLREAMALHRRRRTAPSQAWQPPTDVLADDDEYVIRMDMPGAARESVHAEVEHGVLRVGGRVELPERLAQARRVRGERKLGRFVRSIRLPSDADLTRIEARLSDGVLHIHVRRRQEAGPITIDIEE